MTAAAALAFTIAPTAILMSSDDGTSAQADGCYNGVTVLNPYGKSCTLPGPVNKIRGSAPDANAIIACRHHPGCLSYYVNYPGQTWGPFTPPA
jgi:hypothetical protein